MKIQAVKRFIESRGVGAVLAVIVKIIILMFGFVTVGTIITEYLGVNYGLLQFMVLIACGYICAFADSTIINYRVENLAKELEKALDEIKNNKLT